MQYDRSFQSFHIETRTKLVFDTYPKTQTTPLWHSFHWTWFFRLIKLCYTRNIATRKVQIEMSNLSIITLRNI